MSSSYEGKGFGEDESDVLSRAFDEQSGSEVVLIACPPESIDGEGPVFSHIDSKTIYVLISEKYVEEVVDSAPNSTTGMIQYGMLLGDMMRRGVYYAQNLKKKEKKRRNENE